MSAYSSILTALLTRLQAAAATGKKLDGARIKPYPLEEGNGADDYPYVSMWIPTFEERFRRGRPVASDVRVNIGMSTLRESGIPAHVEWVEKLLDAIEVDPATGNTELQLAGTIRGPYTASVSAANVSKLGLHSQISLSVVPKKAIRRGKRQS